MNEKNEGLMMRFAAGKKNNLKKTKEQHADCPENSEAPHKFIFDLLPQKKKYL